MALTTLGGGGDALRPGALGRARPRALDRDRRPGELRIGCIDPHLFVLHHRAARARPEGRRRRAGAPLAPLERAHRRRPLRIGCRRSASVSAHNAVFLATSPPSGLGILRAALAVPSHVFLATAWGYTLGRDPTKRSLGSRQFNAAWFGAMLFNGVADITSSSGGSRGASWPWRRSSSAWASSRLSPPHRDLLRRDTRAGPRPNALRHRQQRVDRLDARGAAAERTTHHMMKWIASRRTLVNTTGVNDERPSPRRARSPLASALGSILQRSIASIPRARRRRLWCSSEARPWWRFPSPATWSPALRRRARCSRPLCRPP